MPEVSGAAGVPTPQASLRSRAVHWLAALLLALPTLLLPAGSSGSGSLDLSAAPTHGAGASATAGGVGSFAYAEAGKAVAAPLTRSGRGQHVRDARWWPVSTGVEAAALPRIAVRFAARSTTSTARAGRAHLRTTSPRGPPGAGALSL